MSRPLILPALISLAFLAGWPSLTEAQVAPSPVAPPAAVISADHPEAFDPAKATQAWLETVPAEKRARSDSYFEGGYWLILWNFLLTVTICWFLLASRVSARFRDWAERRTHSKTPQVILYSVPFTVSLLLLSFPLELYQNYFREHAYGLATQSIGPWLGDEGKGFALTIVGYILLLTALYAVFRRAPRLWWACGAAVSILLFMADAMLAPVFVSPIFNKYEPVTDPQIREPILALARANQIPVDQVYQFDASRQTNRISANVSGFLGTTRISLNDNLLKQCSLPEIRLVMSHEMGHYVLNHGAKIVTQFALLALAGFLFARIAFDRAVRRWGERWKVRGIGDPAGFPLLVVIASLFLFLVTPMTNTITRVMEREADAFGINTSREADGMARVALKLGSYRKLNPGPLEEFVFFDHPSGRARIRMAMDWKAAQLPVGDVPAK